MRMSKIRHQYSILTPSWQVSPALLTFRRHLPVTKADVLLTFCTYKVLYAKKPGGKNYRGNLPGGVLMATMRCARRHARGHQHQRRRHGVGLLIDHSFCDIMLTIFTIMLILDAQKILLLCSKSPTIMLKNISPDH